MVQLLSSCSRPDPARDIRFGSDTLPLPAELHPGKDTGFLLYDPETDRVLYSHQRRVPFIPASVTKVATTAAALDILGPDCRFTTTLGGRGVLRSGTLYGDIILTGQGDPGLVTADLLELAAALRRRGITNVRGGFLYDDSALLRTPEIDPGMDPDAEYNPGLSALSVEQNMIQALWQPRNEKNGEEIYLLPDLPLYRARMSADRNRRGTRFSLDQGGIWTLRSTPWPWGRTRLPVKDPSLFTAWLFHRLCAIQGIRLPVPARLEHRLAYDVIHKHTSPPLVKIAEQVLLFSSNPMAELLLLRTVAGMGRKAATLAEAAAILAAYHQSRMEQVDWRGFRLVNGSGLTAENRITPEQTVALLRAAFLSLRGGRDYTSLLPAAATSGSLQHRFVKPETALRVWAKTGTIFYSTTLAGVLHTLSGRRLLFAVACTDDARRAVYEREMRSGRRDGAINAAGAWIQEKNRQIDELVMHWIRTL